MIHNISEQTTKNEEESKKCNTLKAECVDKPTIQTHKAKDVKAFILQMNSTKSFGPNHKPTHNPKCTPHL